MECMSNLYVRHLPNDATEFENVLQSAFASGTVHIGTPGSLELRERNGARYAYHRFLQSDGKQADRYVGGPVGESAADAEIERVRFIIERAMGDVKAVKRFRKLNYLCMDDKTGATLAAMHNHQLFDAGLTMIGSHAFGAILNRLGATARSDLTEDIDIVRPHVLQIALCEGTTLLDVLQASGLPFIQVTTGLKPGSRSITHKLPGNERLLVDLLVSGPDVGRPIFVPELKTFAQAVPHLDYLVADRMQSIALSKNYVVPVYVPPAARFAVHKMFSAMTRVNQASKSEKDIRQAATMVSLVEDVYPGDIADAMAIFPETDRASMLAGAGKVVQILRDADDVACKALVDAIDFVERLEQREEPALGEPPAAG